MVISHCELCGKEVKRNGSTPGRFCSKTCMDTWRRNQKPYTREWLYQKYVVEGMGTSQIAHLVNRNPKQVYAWLVGYEIPLREKWQGNVPKAQPYHDVEWLRVQYESGVTPYGIAEACGVKANTVYRYMDKFGIERRTAAETIKLGGGTRALLGEKNPMYGKTGSKSPNWRGGCTPERQALYSSKEWANACSAVWKRDAATCRRCGQKKTDESQAYHVHHIVSFSVKALRTEPSNLVLLCEKCHRWVHSKRNTQRDFLSDD